MTKHHKRRIAILTEVGSRIGYGHLMRCTALYEAAQRYGAHSSLWVYNPEKISPPRAAAPFHQANWMRNNFWAARILPAYDIVIVDSYLATNDQYQRIIQHAHISAAIDDNVRISYPTNIIVNGTIFSDTFPYRKKDKQTLLLGSQYIPLRRPFWSDNAYTVRKRVYNILIIFGGSDAKKMTEKTLCALVQRFPLIHKHVILPRDRDIKHFENSQQITLYQNLNALQLKKLFKKVDVAVSAAGQTLYELATIGVPTITIQVADNQQHNIKGFRRSKFVYYAGKWNDHKVLNQIINGVTFFQTYSKRKTSSSAGKKHVNGKGALGIIQALLAAL
jgi:spore coat polysaccharide biosynthesis predicted glycosyltransferase SpsG